MELLLQVQGAVVLSGYSHELYRPLEEAGWERLEIETVASSAACTRGTGILGPGSARRRVPRTEVIWRNPRAVALAGAAKNGVQLAMLEGGDEPPEGGAD